MNIIKKIRLLIDLVYDDVLMHGEDKDSIDWFHSVVLGGKNGDLILHSNEIGDEVGEVTVLAIVGTGEKNGRV